MIRLAWIESGKAVTVVQQCALAGVSRATVYAQRHPKPMDELDLLLSGLIDGEYTRHPFYGTVEANHMPLATGSVAGG